MTTSCDLSTTIRNKNETMAKYHRFIINSFFMFLQDMSSKYTNKKKRRNHSTAFRCSTFFIVWLPRGVVCFYANLPVVHDSNWYNQSEPNYEIISKRLLENRFKLLNSNFWRWIKNKILLFMYFPQYNGFSVHESPIILPELSHDLILDENLDWTVQLTDRMSSFLLEKITKKVWFSNR